jgi:peptidoglycan/xylan/chitin deacetylase (PgdA/CDA1 family)
VKALRRRLDAEAAAGRRVRFWLRDDDATAPGPALDRLLGLAGSAGWPVTLAVIPEGATEALAVRLAPQAAIAVAIHGWAHRNHAPPGEKPQELGAHRPPGAVLDELARGVARIGALFGPRAIPMLVPPWNRIAPVVVAGLPALGLRALSVFGPERPGPLPEINTQVDLIDWRGGRTGRPAEAIEAAVLDRIAQGGPVGILSHHLVHDAAAWQSLEDLARATAGHPGAEWVGAPDLIPLPRTSMR